MISTKSAAVGLVALAALSSATSALAYKAGKQIGNQQGYERGASDVYIADRFNQVWPELEAMVRRLNPDQSK